MSYKPPRLRPLFSYYGAKHQLAAKYPKPDYDTVIEPFAGSACYSLKYPDRKVILFDVSDSVVELWRYLIRVKESEIATLPVDGFTDVRELKVCEEAKLLIGFWIIKGTATPHHTFGNWKDKNPNSFWGKSVRNSIVRSLKWIRHWRIYQKSYERVKNRRATWFVDPPYQNKCGRAYKHHEIDFTHLGDWCKSREGQVIACEQEGADWLPFRPFHTVKSANVVTKKSVEVIWTNCEPKRKGLGLVC